MVPFAPRSRTLADLLAELADLAGDRVAAVHHAGTTTYRQLHERAQRVAAALRGAGADRSTRVGLLSANRIEWLETYFGAATSGGTVHAFNTWVTGAELESLLADADCHVLVLLERFGRHAYLDELHRLVPEVWDADPGAWSSARFPALRDVVVVDGTAPRGAHDYEDWIAAEPPTEPAAAVELGAATHTGVVLYTSGSTAKPKAVPLLDHGMIENAFHIGERMGLTPDDRVWLGSPLFWSYGCANALTATFTHAATLVLQETFSPEGAVDLIAAEACTAAYLLPTLTHALVSADNFAADKVASLRTGLTIGSSDDLHRAAHELGVREICNVYGATEVYGNCCVTPHTMPEADRLTCQGPPLPGVELRIVDGETRGPRPTGEVGEIEVQGYLTPGYLGSDADNGEVFTADGWYRTGDLGHLDEHGWIHFAARESEIIKTSGINVAPAEVEQCLLAIEGVDQVGVVGGPDPHKDEVVVAFVVRTPDAELNEDDVLGRCRKQLASYKVPTHVHFVDELPKTNTGKISRKLLKRQVDGVRDGDVA